MKRGWLQGRFRVAGRIAVLLSCVAVPLPLVTAAAEPDAPNIVLILLDDVGFGGASTFGGPAQTPALDRLAAQGLRYNRFHVPALCSPTRAALLSGRNDHRAGFGQIMEAASDFPGYNGIWRKDTVTVAEVLRRSGYSTAAFGKWHNTPYAEVSPAGPFERWPTGLGFDYYYGFMRGWESHWEPSSLYRNTTPVEPAATPAEGYHLTTDIVDDAIGWVRTQASLAPEKPYFLYFATGATHAPHHVAKEWIDKYRGQFDQGWDVLRTEIFKRQKKLGVIPADALLTPRPAGLPAWNTLSKDQKRLAAREMEVYAAFLAHTDYEVGRLIQAAEQGPRGDNTLILYIVGDNGAEGAVGDNGAAGSRASGAPWADFATQLRRMDELGGELATYNIFPAAWAWATSTPFQHTKFVASHLGGTRDPLVVSWPAKIKDRNGVRSQYAHVNDVAATLYEVTGMEFPSVVDGVKQQPLDGTSLAYSFDAPEAPSRHRLQIYEQAGNRAIYQDGWLAGAVHMLPWMREAGDMDFDNDRWELYNLEEDFSQAHDVAGKYPEKLAELQTVFAREATENNVHPLQNYGTVLAIRPNIEKRQYVYYPQTPRIPLMVAPGMGWASYLITADVELADDRAQGAIVSFGSRIGGFALYLQDGKLVYENQAFSGAVREVIAADTPLSAGKFTLKCEFIRQETSGADRNWRQNNSGTVRLYIDGRQVAEKYLAQIVPDIYTGTLGIGRAYGSPVSATFRPPFPFNGELNRITVDVR